MFASSGLGEEGVERVIRDADGVVGGHHAVGMDPVLEAEEFPSGVAHLDAGLTDVNGNDLSLEY